MRQIITFDSVVNTSDVKAMMSQEPGACSLLTTLGVSPIVSIAC